MIGNTIEIEFFSKGFAVALTANELCECKSNLVIELLIDYFNGETVDKLIKRVKEVLRSIVVRCCCKQNDFVVCVRTGKLMQPLIGIT